MSTVAQPSAKGYRTIRLPLAEQEYERFLTEALPLPRRNSTCAVGGGAPGDPPRLHCGTSFRAAVYERAGGRSRKSLVFDALSGARLGNCLCVWPRGEVLGPGAARLGPVQSCRHAGKNRYALPPGPSLCTTSLLSGRVFPLSLTRTYRRGSSPPFPHHPCQRPRLHVRAWLL